MTTNIEILIINNIAFLIKVYINTGVSSYERLGLELAGSQEPRELMGLLETVRSLLQVVHAVLHASALIRVQMLIVKVPYTGIEALEHHVVVDFVGEFGLFWVGSCRLLGF